LVGKKIFETYKMRLALSTLNAIRVGLPENPIYLEIENK